MATPAKPVSWTALFTKLEQRTHAGTVVLGAAIADQQLQDAILTKLPNVSKKLENELFTGYGPLSSFASKIALGYAMGLIDRINYERLTAVRQIRNKFAHPADFTDFQTQEIQQLVAKFPPGAPADLQNEYVYMWHLQQVEQYLVTIAGPHIRKSSTTAPNV